MGAGAPDHAGRRARDHLARHRIVSADRAAAGGDHGRLSRCGRRNGRAHRHAGHRAAAFRHRSPDVFQLDLERQRRRTDHADLRAGHQSRYRAGANAEQGHARHAASADGSDAARHRRRQAESGLPDVRLDQVRRRQARFVRARQHPRHARGRSGRPRAGRRQHVPDRIGIRDAHLARCRQAARLFDVVRAGAECGACAERAGRRRFDWLGAGRQRNGLYRDGARRNPLHHRRAVREHHPARECGRHDGSFERCRARRDRRGRLRPPRRLQRTGGVGFWRAAHLGRERAERGQGSEIQDGRTSGHVSAGRELVRSV